MSAPLSKSALKLLRQIFPAARKIAIPKRFPHIWVPRPKLFDMSTTGLAHGGQGKARGGVGQAWTPGTDCDTPCDGCFEGSGGSSSSSGGGGGSQNPCTDPIVGATTLGFTGCCLGSQHCATLSGLSGVWWSISGNGAGSYVLANLGGGNWGYEGVCTGTITSYVTSDCSGGGLFSDYIKISLFLDTDCSGEGHWNWGCVIYMWRGEFGCTAPPFAPTVLTASVSDTNVLPNTYFPSDCTPASPMCPHIAGGSLATVSW